VPTVFREEGFRFFFYSNEMEEPMHVHVEKGEGEGKVWLEPKIETAYFLGLKEQERKRALQSIQSHIGTIVKAWNEHFH
jgi:hypothetical protein